MPFSGFDDWDDCVQTMTEEEGHDMESAENICGALQAEEKSDHGNVAELRAALEQGAGLIADVGVDLVSGVDVPAVDSKWVMTKSGGARRGRDYRAQSPVLLAKQDDDEDEDDQDQRISYAAAMIPREPDKEGDVVATPTVEHAAHDFLKQDGGVDTDHSLIDGEGEVVESWVLKQEREFNLPGGATETYGAGTWMVGIEWGTEAWSRIQNGELTGLSIYGMAEHVALEKACGCDSTTTAAKDFVVPFADESVVNVLYASRSVAAKAARRMGFDGDDEDITHPHQFGDQTHYMPAPSHEEFVDAYNEFAESDAFGPVDEDGETVSAAAKEDDPCWEGYTMVGLDENGDPRCVPDDDVPDANLENAVTRTPDMSEPPATHKSDGHETEDMASDNSGDGASTDDGDPTIREVAASLDDLAGTVESLKEAVETEKQDDQEAAAMLAEDRGMEPGDILDVLSVAEGKEVAEILDAIDEVKASASPEDKAEHDDGEDDDEDEEEMGASAEKRADEANLQKGADGRNTAAAGHEATDDNGDPLSYRAVAEQQGDF